MRSFLFPGSLTVAHHEPRSTRHTLSFCGTASNEALPSVNGRNVYVFISQRYPRLEKGGRPSWVSKRAARSSVDYCCYSRPTTPCYALRTLRLWHPGLAPLYLRQPVMAIARAQNLESQLRKLFRILLTDSRFMRVHSALAVTSYSYTDSARETAIVHFPAA